MKCPECGEEMEEVVDPISKEKNGYLWHCKCMGKDTNLSIG